MHNLIRLSTAGLLALAAVAANADIAFNNFGVGDTFSASAWNDNQAQSLAMPFTSATTGAVSSITVALGLGANYTAHLELDDNGLNPGTIIESWNFAGTGAAQTLTGTGSVNITNGTNYWLEIDPQTVNDNGSWFENSVGQNGTFLYTNGGTWFSFTSTESVFRVQTTAAPEPVSLAGLALGAGFLALRRRRRS